MIPTPRSTRCFLLPICLVLVAICPLATHAHEQQLYLSRYVPNLKYSDADLTKGSENAAYKAIFGEGDKQGDLINGMSRIGELSVGPGGKSAQVSRSSEEYVIYVHEGQGILHYGKENRPIRKGDFFYVPAGTKHGLSNPNDAPVKAYLMGFHIDSIGSAYQPKAGLQIANEDEVELQVLGSHGPTTKYKLLMGDTTSERDRLAAASLMKSLFIMDFSPRGTNNPHRHATQEEVYFVLQGSGYMIAGLDAWGNVDRHPSQEGDAFYWAAGTEVGFYSLNKEGEEHSIILAVRSDDPTKK